jgi:hypothetical protein
MASGNSPDSSATKRRHKVWESLQHALDPMRLHVSPWFWPDSGGPNTVIERMTAGTPQAHVAAQMRLSRATVHRWWRRRA